MRAVVLPHAFGLRSIVAGWTWCATSMASAAAARTATTTIHSPTHRRLRQPLRRQRRTARPCFTRPAWPRRVLRSHHQRDSGETRFFNTTKAIQATTRNLLAGFLAQPRPPGASKIPAKDFCSGGGSRWCLSSVVAVVQW